MGGNKKEYLFTQILKIGAILLIKIYNRFRSDVIQKYMASRSAQFHLRVRPIGPDFKVKK